MTREGVLFTRPVGCNRLPSALNDLANKISKNMSSTSVRSTATTKYSMKKTTNATFGVDKKELVQVAFLQIRGGDGA